LAGEAEVITLLSMALPDIVDLPPAVGDAAAGHGVTGTIAVIPDRQPLAQDGIWRVTLRGEGFGRLVRHGGVGYCGAAWQLLRIDDLTDAQLDAYDEGMLDAPEGNAAP
jgi:hypothetical protein